MGTTRSRSVDPKIFNLENEEKLREHSNEFNKEEIIKVNDKIWVAIGYGLANSIFLEGSTGLCIIDTMDSIQSAQKALKDFRLTTSINKPVQAYVLLKICVFFFVSDKELIAKTIFCRI